MTIFVGVLIGLATLAAMYGVSMLIGRCIDAMCGDDDAD